ncbi:6397_t:CDS:2 [Paraglomus occultum]|uniref:6397_t:CDS:1 n=1 Tax=Paraglomus occultum TaxID=144539 RepID=A0A9N8VQI8_9GLOM|nr:6397_t:CDS:2 [Paraglomus occultum]
MVEFSIFHVLTSFSDFILSGEVLDWAGVVESRNCFKKIGFTYIQRKRAEEALFNALKAIISENGEQAATAQKLLANFNEIVNSITALGFGMMKPSAKEKQNTLRRPRWEKSIKPLIDKYALAVEVKPESVFDDYVQSPSTKIIFEIPFEGEFDLKKHYDLLWVQDIYRRFTLLFALSFNMLRDANTLEIAYRESFVNPIIPKAFEDVNDKISGEIESAQRKQHQKGKSLG